jgi:hypothetical protein
MPSTAETLRKPALPSEFILSFPPNPLQKNKTDFSKVNQKNIGLIILPNPATD